MMRTTSTAVAVALAVLNSAAAASAGTMPRKFEATRDAVGKICERFGDNLSFTAWDFKPGEYGCADAKNGHVILCKSSGTCTFYYGPRRLRGQARQAA